MLILHSSKKVPPQFCLKFVIKNYFSLEMSWSEWKKKVRSEFGLNESQTETVDIFVQFYSLNYSQQQFRNFLFRHSSQVEPIPNDNNKKQHIVIAIHWKCDEKVSKYSICLQCLHFSALAFSSLVLHITLLGTLFSYSCVYFSIFILVHHLLLLQSHSFTHNAQ